MPDGSNSENAGGVVVKVPKANTEIRASDQSVKTAEQAYERTLRWAHEDQPEFYSVIGLIALFAVLRFLRKREFDRMKLEYDRERREAADAARERPKDITITRKPPS